MMPLTAFTTEELKLELRRRELQDLRKEYEKRTEIVQFIYDNDSIEKFCRLLGHEISDIIDRGELDINYKFTINVDKDNLVSQCFLPNGKKIWE
jgi:5'-deoxynucleotidase YfbR-like HD superfamily hydrolase